MGFATVVLFFCRFLPSWAILASGAGLVAVMPLLRDMVDFTVFCGNELVNAPVISRFVPGILVEPVSGYKIIWSFKRIAQGFLFYGNFPVLPWLMFPPLGFVIGRLIVQGKMRRWVYNLTSRFSLTFYCMHYMLIRWTIYAVYLVTGRFLSSDLMSAIPALTCGDREQPGNQGFLWKIEIRHVRCNLRVTRPAKRLRIRRTSTHQVS